MSIQTHPLNPEVELKGLRCPVELVLDRLAKEITVETEGLDDNAITVTTTKSGALRIRGIVTNSPGETTIVRQDRKGTTITYIQSGGDINISGVDVDGDTVTVNGSTYTTSGNVTVTSRRRRRSLLDLILGRNRSVDTVKSTGPRKVTVTLPAADITVKGCSDVTGEIAGNLDATVSSLDRLTLEGARTVNLNLSGNAQATVEGVAGDVFVDASSLSRAVLRGKAGAIQVDASGNAAIEIEGTTGTGNVQVDASSLSRVDITGDVGDISLAASGNAAIHVHGTCQNGRASASSMGRVKVDRALGRVKEIQNGFVASVEVG